MYDVIRVKILGRSLIILLADKRLIVAPLEKFPKLLNASGFARDNWKMCGAGTGITWPDIDEDLSIGKLLEYEIK